MEVHRTCQFVATVLTPAVTGNGGSTYRFDGHNIQSPAELMQQNYPLTEICPDHIGKTISLTFDLGLFLTLDHHPGKVLRSGVAKQ